jgi:pimeloyl-ACP methyl ester carboxylesterase
MRNWAMAGVVFAFSCSAAPDATAEEAMPKCINDWVAQGHYIDFEGREIFVHSSGPVGKEGVLVVHGYPGSSWDFKNVVGPVAEETRIAVPDMIGFGHSDKPLDGTYKENYSLMLQADMYEAVVADEGLETVILVAHDMGQTVGLELMARQDEGKLPFRIKHAILLNGSTLVDMVELADMQKTLLQQPDVAATEDISKEQLVKGIRPTYGPKIQNLDAILDCQASQIIAKNGDKVMAQTLRYLDERREFYDRWAGTLTGFRSAPMTVIWGTSDPVAIEAMADRVKLWRPETDLYKLEGIGHWPSIEASEFISEAILHRVPSE